MDEKLWIKALMDEGSYVPFVNGRAGVTGGMGLMDGRPVCYVRAAKPTIHPARTRRFARCLRRYRAWRCR